MMQNVIQNVQSYSNSNLSAEMKSLINTACFIYVLFVMNTNAEVTEPSNIVVVVLSQKEGYHAAHADYLRKSIYEQASALEKEAPEVVLSHELNIRDSWIITPLLVYLSNTFPNAQWFFFCLENTVIRLEKLLNDLWIGHALYDHEPTIIHHFEKHSRKFKYPNIASGFAMTFKLLKSLSQQVSEGRAPKPDFSIDASYEFANFVLKSTNVRLTHVSKICIVSGSDCATYPRFFHPCNSISPEKVYFAVKTCARFHTDRIPIIKQTWAKHTVNIGYFSDTADKHLRHAYVVPNTTEGHCAKTYAILQTASNILKKHNLDWLVISDDDTIFSVARLLRLLTCYNPTNPIAIGERYGFRTWDYNYGYNYLTGGGGVVLSAPLVHRIIEPGICDCPSATTPDDMHLFGACLLRLGYIHSQPVHSPLFHQARSIDYATGYLASQEPVSFHKFWMIEPKVVYDEWFAEADSNLSESPRHTEL
ncbi:beta-1,3-glucosyltransferase isoform X2 [Odontomachus brunneus]|uniref:beta-1,3-glucosyltransferase isoform X2 n=1 Tax=Odontomachus brunneus TaxID=486640 RepID=UPI0013F27F75|nr:beta-1,3-glucosyltransferase isoform X2 [Odontomachus brunneus]